MSATSTSAPTPPRVLLATLTPGAELARAFGHVALVFEERGMRHGMPDAEEDLVAYSYGGLVVPELTFRFGEPGAERLLDAIAAAAHASLAPVVHGTLCVNKVREGLAAFRRHLAPEQRCELAELRLTAPERQRLHTRVREDFARTEPGQRRPGTYAYDHFRSNCATRVRDIVFGAMGRDREHVAHRVELDVSFADVMHESLSVAVSASPGGLRLFPSGWHAALAAFLPGAPLVARAPSDFLAALRFALERLAPAAVFRTPKGKQTLLRSFQLLESEIPRRPRRLWDTLFTPARLRSAFEETRMTAERTPALL